MSDNDVKVEQFLLLAKSARGLALADLIVKATAEPGLYAFGEFLSLPAVQEVRGLSRRAPPQPLLPLLRPRPER